MTFQKPGSSWRTHFVSRPNRRRCLSPLVNNFKQQGSGHHFVPSASPFRHLWKSHPCHAIPAETPVLTCLPLPEVSPLIVYLYSGKPFRKRICSYLDLVPYSLPVLSTPTFYPYSLPLLSTPTLYLYSISLLSIPTLYPYSLPLLSAFTLHPS